MARRLQPLTSAAYLGHGGPSQPGNAQRGVSGLISSHLEELRPLARRSETLAKHPRERRHPACENETLSSERQRAGIEALCRGGLRK